MTNLEKQDEDYRDFIVTVIEDYMGEVEFEEFLQDTANIIFRLEDRIIELEEKVEELENAT